MFAREDLLGKSLAPVSRAGITGLRFDADAVRWQAGGKPEAVPPEALISIRRPRPGRGIVVGVLAGLAVGMVAGFAIGAAVGSACPGDCGQPAQGDQRGGSWAPDRPAPLWNHWRNDRRRYGLILEMKVIAMAMSARVPSSN